MTGARVRGGERARPLEPRSAAWRPFADRQSSAWVVVSVRVSVR